MGYHKFMTNEIIFDKNDKKNVIIVGENMSKQVKAVSQSTDLFEIAEVIQ